MKILENEFPLAYMYVRVTSLEQLNVAEFSGE